MTYTATLATLVQRRLLQRYEPMLRFGRQQAQYVYICPDAYDAIINLEDHPNGEQPDPLPKAQVIELLNRFSAGEPLVAGFDFRYRGQKIFLWITRSVRIAGLHPSPTHFVALLVAARGAGHSWQQWYRQTRRHAVYQEMAEGCLRGEDLGV